MKTTRFLPLVVALSLAHLPRAAAEVKLASLFSDHAVLQRGQPVPVWGTAEAGEEVTVEFAGQKQTTKTGADGKWKVALTPLKEAESLTLTVKGKNTVTVNDVAVGEVWVNSGQSNMAFMLTRDANGAAATAAAADPQLRFFAVGGNTSDTPLADVKGSKWVVSAPETAARFSAVGYYFARELRKTLKVPVGMLGTSVGGTPAEAWTSGPALDAHPELRKELTAAHEAALAIYPKALANFEKTAETRLAEWKIATEKAKAAGQPGPRKPAPPIDPAKGTHRPSCLFNAMVAPLQPYAIRGAIWYQGESNSGRAAQYRTLFPAMIADWRKGWGQGEFPFFFVQITPHNNMTPEIREAQLFTTQTVPHTAMAVTTDIGHPTDIHPTQKEPIGVRLALAARAQVYGEKKLEFSGPTFASMKINGAQAVLKFSHAAGLAAKDGAALKGFTVAGEDKNFVPAKAEIKGETVIVSAEGVAKPAAVRYGWANVPDVNLINAAGLPTSPFRTDAEK